MAIELKNVTKFYGARRVVDGITLTINKGSVFGFLGPNGAGKTTTVKMIVGLASIDEGTINIGRKPSRDLSVKEKIGFMPESPYFYEHLTGFEFLEFCGRLFRTNPDKKKVVYGDLFNKVGISAASHQKIGTYSKGMKQRLAFAQALVNDPEYLFLDEPLDGLDPIGRREIKAIIKQLKASGKTIFFNSHILFDTEELCDEIGIINNGRLLYSGPVKEFCGGKSLEEQFVEVVENL